MPIDKENKEFFTTDFRKVFLAVLLSDVDKVNMFSPFIPESVFKEGVYKVIYNAILNVAKRIKGGTINYALVESEVIEICEKKGMNTEVVLETLKELSIMNIEGTEEIILEKVRVWILKNRLVEALQNSIMMLSKVEDEDGINKIVKTVENAVNTQMNAVSYIEFNDLYLLPDEAEEDRKKLISSGFKCIDDCLYGGFDAKTVTILLGGAKGGKTSFLIQLATNFLKQNLNVFHISLELQEKLIKHKYTCCITGLSFLDVFEKKELAKERLKKFKEKYSKGNIIIKKFLSGRTDVFMIKSFINAVLRQKRIEKPDVILIDYDKLIKPSINHRDMYENAGQVYLDLIGLAEIFDCPIIVPSQTNRGGWKKSEEGHILTSSDISESGAKKMHCDNIFSLNPIGDRRMILYIDTVRSGFSKKEFDFEMDLTKNRFIELVNNEPYKMFPDVDDTELIIKDDKKEEIIAEYIDESDIGYDF